MRLDRHHRGQQVKENSVPRDIQECTCTCMRRVALCDAMVTFTIHGVVVECAVFRNQLAVHCYGGLWLVHMTSIVMARDGVIPSEWNIHYSPETITARRY